jgi:metal iron transporter
MVCEGQLNWTFKPWVRRLITRSISITPSIIIAAAVGRDGLSDALEASQVCLSVILPFVSAPLIYFTCRSKIMSVWAEDRITTPPAASSGAKDTDKDGSGKVGALELQNATSTQEGQVTGRYVIMRNNWWMAGCALVIWLIVVVMNVAMLVLVGMGKA